jgi:predicted MFS family arabinose efflux permease
MLAERAPTAVRGRAFGAMHAITGLAVLPANLVFGVLYERSPVWAFGTSAAAAALAALLLALIVEDEGPKPAAAPTGANP